MNRPYSFSWLAALVCACSLSDVEYIGKTCTTECPEGLYCVSGQCQREPASMSPGITSDAGSDGPTPGGQGGGSGTGGGAPSAGGGTPNGMGGGAPGSGGGAPATGGGAPGTGGGSPTGGGAPDSGIPPKPDAGVVIDAGTPNPCDKCTNTQRCINQQCVNESDISGSACSASKACPSGFYCAANICVKDGARYCDTVKLNGLERCLDFDGAQPADQFWKKIEAGPLTFVNDSARSPPKAMRSEIPYSDSSSNYVQTILYAAVQSTSWSKLTLTFDLRYDFQTIPAGAYLATAQVMCIATSGPQYRGLYMSHTKGDFGNLAIFQMEQPNGQNSIYQPWDKQPANATWNRIRMQVDRTGGNLTGTIWLNGELAKMGTVGGCSGDWRITIGVGGYKLVGTALYDNVTIQAE
jgi:hypothetical protein